MRRYNITLPDSLLDEYLHQQLSVLELSLRHGVSRAVIVRNLRLRGARLRTASEQQRIRVARLTPEQRSANARAAHDAIRGTTKSVELLRKCALMRQAKGRSTEREAQWAARLAELGVATVAQYAIDIFNFDLAVPDARVAIEVQCDWHRIGRHAERDARKRAACEAAGWLLLELYTKHKSDAALLRVRDAVQERKGLILRQAPC